MCRYFVKEDGDDIARSQQMLSDQHRGTSVYEKNGLLKGRKTKDGETDYLEADLQYIGKFHFLQTAGMDADLLKQFIRLLEKGPDTREEH